MLKKLFNKLSGPRFIDIYGRPWHKKGAIDQLDFMEKSALTFGVSGLFYSTACVQSGLAWTFLMSMLGMSAAFFVSNSDKFFVARDFGLNKYAIDREGRSFPPANDLSLKLKTASLVQNLKRQLLAQSAIVTSTVLLNITSFVVENGFTALPHIITQNNLGTILGGCAYALSVPAGLYLDMRRAQKLINGTYTFCGTPPAEPKKESAGVVAGAFKPSVS